MEYELSRNVAVAKKAITTQYDAITGKSRIILLVNIKWMLLFLLDVETRQK